MKLEPQTFIFIGRSGCGKGTQADLLTKKLLEVEGADSREMLHLESGDRFREFINSHTYASELSRKIYERGDLQPSFLSIGIWANMMIDSIKGGEHIMLDGIPRRVEEVLVLDSAFQFYGRKSITVIHLDISEAEAIHRMQARHRFDDVPENIRIRMDWFKTTVLPAIDKFRELPGYNVLDINGERSVEEIHQDIIGRLGL